MSQRASTTKRSGRRGRRGRARSRRRRLPRALLPLAAVALVVAVSVVVFLYESVTSRFDGRLWELPSKIFSDARVLTPGDAAAADELAERLDRCGYARVPSAPTRPGQYRRSSDGLEVHLRAVATPGLAAAPLRVAISSRRDRVVALRGPDGRAVPRAVFEPELLASLYGPRQEERVLVRREEIPQLLVEAVLAAEDGRFFSHHGLDFRGILRAAVANARERRVVQGGSTITQQTVKNLFLGQQRTWWRKLREVAMAPILDARYDKDRILEVYLNEVYLGQRGAVAICGVQAAALHYLGRGLADLSLAETALLAGLIRSPGTYNPFVHPERARGRRDQILDALVRRGAIGAAEAQAARAETLRLASGAGGFDRAPYAVDFVVAQLRERYPRRVLEQEGLRIYTTLDTALQSAAEEALGGGLARMERDRPLLRRQAKERSLQGAVIVARPASAEILALVGGRDYRTSQFNRAVQARRQPGSLFKPFVFAAGFELSARHGANGLTPASVLLDSPLEMVSGGAVWSPANYDGLFRGRVTVRRALEESLNVPTVRAAQQIGLEEVIRTARACGIRSPLAALPSLPLGTAEVTPLELVEAYGTLARDGRRVAPWVIRAVTDSNGTLIEGARPEAEQAIRPQSAYLVRDLLRGVFERGTARSASSLGFHCRAAGKTGTTDDSHDAWFVGFTDELLSLVWVGYDDNAPTGLTGASGALPIWVDLVGGYCAPSEAGVVSPGGIVTVAIDPDTGGVAGPRCPVVVMEAFARGTEPTEPCPLHPERGRFRRWLRRMFGGGREV